MSQIEMTGNKGMGCHPFNDMKIKLWVASHSALVLCH